MHPRRSSYAFHKGNSLLTSTVLVSNDAEKEFKNFQHDISFSAYQSVFAGGMKIKKRFPGLSKLAWQ